jgi:hypothetical protein
VTDGTDCTDDGNDCNDDVCLTGLCAHPPEPPGTLCGDPTDTECDNPDSCDGAGGCLDNFEAAGLPCGDSTDTQCDNPDICDNAGACTNNFEPDGTACDDAEICTGDDVCTSGTCSGTGIAQAPLLVSQGPRHLEVTPLPAGSVAPVALRLTSPDWPCLDKYLLSDGSLYEPAGAPFAQLPDDWGTVIIRDVEIVPGSEYHIVAECGGLTSATGSATTAVFGDIVGVFDIVNSIWTPPNGIADVVDMKAIADAFSNLPTAPPVKRADESPCTLNRLIDIVDVVNVVDGFAGETYAQATGCPLPPLQPCP